MSSIDAMRRSVDQLEEGGHAGRSGNSYIDLGLLLLACLRKPGETLTIQAIEDRALRKVRQRLVETASDQELAEEIRETLARNRTSP